MMEVSRAAEAQEAKPQMENYSLNITSDSTAAALSRIKLNKDGTGLETMNWKS